MAMKIELYTNLKGVKKIEDNNMQEEIKTKVCNKCGRELPATYDYFYKQLIRCKTKPDYYILSPYCKDCDRELSRKRQKENYSRSKQTQYEWRNREENKGKISATCKKWRENNKEWKQQYQLEYQRNNKDKINGYAMYKQQHGTHKISSKEWEACKKYFVYRCAYCGLPIEEHYITYRGEVKLGDFHKEHINHEGANDLSNCVPSCKSCNDRKWTYKLDEWYNTDNPNFTKERYDKIIQWINEDYEQYISEI